MIKASIAALAASAAVAFAIHAQADDGISTAEMTGKWGSATIEKDDDGSVKLSSPGGKNTPAALASKEFAVTDTASNWTLSFSAKGDVYLNALLSNKKDPAAKSERQDILPKTKLGPEWKPYSVTFKIPEGTVKSSLSVFIWEDKGSAEIKDLKLAPATPEAK